MTYGFDTVWIENTKLWWMSKVTRNLGINSPLLHLQSRRRRHHHPLPEVQRLTIFFTFL